MDAKEYWDEHYGKAENSAPKVNDFLKQMVSRLQKGKVLDVAMGAGQNSVFLAENGFKATGFDISDSAIDLAKKYAAEKNQEIDARVLDSDFFMMRPMEYDCIIMTRYKPALGRFFSEMIRGLKHGGTILIESLSVEAMEEALSSEDSHKDIYFNVNEIIRSLDGLTILFYQEANVDGVEVVQCLARKPIDRDVAKYDLFDMHAKSDTPEKQSKQLELAERLFRK